MLALDKLESMVGFRGSNVFQAMAASDDRSFITLYDRQFLFERGERLMINVRMKCDIPSWRHCTLTGVPTLAIARTIIRALFTDGGMREFPLQPANYSNPVITVNVLTYLSECLPQAIEIEEAALPEIAEEVARRFDSSEIFEQIDNLTSIVLRERKLAT